MEPTNIQISESARLLGVKGVGDHYEWIKREEGLLVRATLWNLLLIENAALREALYERGEHPLILGNVLKEHQIIGRIEQLKKDGREVAMMGEYVLLAVHRVTSRLVKWLVSRYG